MISINVVDCEIPYVLADPKHEKYNAYTQRYSPLFKEIDVKGVFSWYELFNVFAKEKKIFRAKVVLEAARSRFSSASTAPVAEKKQNRIIYAARLTEQKRPVMFVEAARILHERYPELIKGWEFEMYGKGPLEETIKRMITEHQLASLIKMKESNEMQEVFAGSKCFVSTQEHENFPSLSMNEAMASGNAIIACNVGQTGLFVENGKNGFLSSTDDSDGIAMALKDYLSKPEQHLNFQAESIRLTKEVHTPENFIRQVDAYWAKLM